MRPNFSSALTQYTDTVENKTLSINVTPTVALASAKVKIAGVAAVSGTASTVKLALGMNNIKVVVTAEDPAVDSTCTINVYRMRSFRVRFGGVAENGGYSGLQLPDSNFIMVGFNPGPVDRDAFILKTNQFGDSLWMHTFNWPNDDEIYDVRSTKDDGFIMAGSTGGLGGLGIPRPCDS